MLDRILFVGTPSIAVPFLEALINSGLNLIGVVTVPDKKAGRSLKLQPSAIKVFAKKNNLKCWQPENKVGLTKQIKQLKPTLVVVFAYGKLIPVEALNLVPAGWLNVHPSLLPLLRGPAPISAAIKAGFKETGISIMVLDQDLDHGPLLAQTKFKLDSQATTGSLTKEIMTKGPSFLLETILQYEQGKIKPVAQNHQLATFTNKITNQDRLLDFKKNSLAIDQKIRSLLPQPGPRLIWQEKLINIAEIKLIDLELPLAKPGILCSWKKKLLVASLDSWFEIKMLQLPGKTLSSGLDFINGNQQKICKL